jgi:hypothetical protein
LEHVLTAIVRTSHQSLRRRFFAPKRGFSETELAFFLNIDLDNRVKAREGWDDTASSGIRFPDSAGQQRHAAKGSRTQHPAWSLRCSLVRSVFFSQPWSDPESEIGVGAAEAEQNSGDEGSEFLARMKVRSRRAKSEVPGIHDGTLSRARRAVLRWFGRLR